MPKTGGMSVYRILREISPTYAVVRGPRRHSPVEDIPPELLEGKKLFGTVRDPWSWYASLYQHAASGADGLEKLEKWGGGDTSFEAVLYGWTHPSEDRVQDQFGVVWEFPGDQAPDLRRKLLDSGQGFYTWAFDYVYGDPIRPYILIDTSRLAEGVAELLGVPLSEVEAVRMQNRATHRPKSAFKVPQEEYTEEMRDWVWEAEKQLVGIFDSKPFWRAPSPVVWEG